MTESVKRMVPPLLHVKFGGSMMSVVVFAARETRSLVADDKSEPNNGKSDKSFLDLGQANVLVLSDLESVAGGANMKALKANGSGMNVARVKLANFDNWRYWTFLVRWGGVIDRKGRHAWLQVAMYVKPKRNRIKPGMWLGKKQKRMRARML